jgi:proteasome accessory factor C
VTGATDRLPRLLALVPYLLHHPGAHVREVARLFGVSEKQLLADLTLVWMCGLPGHTPGDLIDVSVEQGRITLANADTIARPLRLTADEALALLVALRTLADLPGLSERDAVDRALAKLERAAGDAAAAAERVRVAVEAEEEPTVAAVRDALTGGRRLHLRYYVPGRDEVTERDVDPMRLLVVDGRAYLEGWCRRVEAVRLFRLDRVLAVTPLDAAAEVPAEARPRDVDAGLYAASPADLRVRLALAPAARWVADYHPCEQVSEAPDGRLVVVLPVADPRWVRRLALRLGGDAQILDPPGLARDVAADARAALAAYGEVRVD